MNRDEELVAEWLCSKGHEVCHLTDGQDPPDLVMDSDIAIEVTTINSLAHRSVWQFLDEIFKSLGPAENGRGYWVSIEYEDERILQSRNSREKAKRKKDLKIGIKQRLTEHYDNPDLGVVIQLPYGLTLEIMGEITDNPDRYKYKVGWGMSYEGELVITTLVENIQAAIDTKSAKKKIQEEAKRYQEWWLVVTDAFSNVHTLDQDEWKAVSGAIVRREPWKRIIAVAVGSQRVLACRIVAN